jgi:uncharacterized protein YjiS (DUF1127 family)
VHDGTTPATARDLGLDQMNARVARDELAILLPNTMTHYVRGDVETAPEAGRSGLLARAGAALRWLAELPKRRAVLDELGSLSDHELADIGLTRAELPLVFDPAFASDREQRREGALPDHAGTV